MRLSVRKISIPSICYVCQHNSAGAPTASISRQNILYHGQCWEPAIVETTNPDSRRRWRLNKRILPVFDMSGLQDISVPAPPLVEFVCTIVGSVLWGITCMQTFLYIIHHQEKDPLWIKFMVAWLWLMDTAHTVIVARGFWVLVYKVHDPFILSQEYLYAGVFTALVALPTQLFFTYRVWKISNKWTPLAVVFVIAAVYQLGASIAFTTICLQHGPTAEIIFQIEKLPMSLWGVGAAQDILISAVLLWMLWTSRGGPYFHSTDQMLARLSVLVVNTGVWTALVALFIIITMVAWPTVQIYVSLYFILCPLYCNTLLANLNARQFIRGRDFYEPRQGSSGNNPSNPYPLRQRMFPAGTETDGETEVTVSHVRFAENPDISGKPDTLSV
ncbi:hypothetical protein C8R47DRAFT_1112826 [Mycena vitilis]|nr:hypothetical protein C8R47DRAFT_1112826 [Mycena vitilis]